jgi:hypothetical protein
MDWASRISGMLAIGLGLAVAGPVVAQFDQSKPPPPDLPKPSPDPRNIEGVWFKQATVDDPNARKKFGDNVAPPPLPEMTEEGKALYKQRDDARLAGHPLWDAHRKCVPPGTPRILFQVYPFQIIQTPGLITFVHEDNRSNWFVHMDQKQPAKPPAPTWMGHSVGHWEGDTLVVDTISQRPENIIYPALPMRAETHIVQRFKKIDGGAKLEDVYTVDDPKLFTKPFTGRFEFLWWPQERVLEYICEEADHPEDENAAPFH